MAKAPIIPKPLNETTGEPSWRWRRIAFFMVLIFSLYRLNGMVDRIDSELNQIIASGLLWLLGALIMIYMGFATAQDMLAIFITKSGRPYAAPPGSVETETKTTTKVVTDPAPADPAAKPIEVDPNAPPSGFAQ